MMGAFDRQAAADLASVVQGLPWLEGHRRHALERWLGAPLPTRKTEAWKYTSLEALGDRYYLRRSDGPGMPAGETVPFVAGLDADRLVFVNGRYCPELSSIGGDEAARAVCFSEANDADRALILRHLGALETSRENPFVALNGAWLADGVLLYVPAGVRRQRTLCIVHVGVPQAEAFSVAQRLLVVLEPHAEARIIEHFCSAGGEQNLFATATTEISLAEGARLGHCRLNLEEEHSLHIGGVYVGLGASAAYDGFVLGLGSRLKRVDLRIRHQGEGSECRLNGVYLCKGKQHIDLHACVEHEVPHGSTQEIFRGIIDDEAHAVFNGRIHIHPRAQKTSADLSNRNLLLSNAAEIDTKPELEIYADDVRCSHGATVSRIDERSLYYLQSRGIDRAEAETMLSFGFINELFDALPEEALAVALRGVLTDWFGRDARLSRHLG
jgi:Fe-S cluster assembly protein SufD